MSGVESQPTLVEGQASRGVVPRGRDFSDRLSPMIVKELRQGLRTKTFVGLFIGLQALMMIVILVSLLSAGAGNDAASGTGFFWAMIGIPTLLVMPLRGLGVVSNEIKANTLELVLLTRLSAQRIVLGKWLAIVAQTGIFVCAVLPYVVLRYFLGGVNLADELVTLFLMMIGSAVLAAIAVGISPYQNRLTKVFLWIGILLGAQVILPFFFFVGMARGLMPVVPLVGWVSIGGVLVLGGLIVALMLEVGAARIAPEAENHALSQRLLGAAMLIPPAVLVVLGSPVAPVLSALAVVVLIPIIAVAVCEPVRWNPGIYRRFAQRGWIGGVAARFLSPGWAAGSNYALVMLVLIAWLAQSVKFFELETGSLAFTAIAGAILLPAALIRLIIPATTKPIVSFISFQAVCLILIVVTMAIDQILSTSISLWLAGLPTCGLFFLLRGEFGGPADAAYLKIYFVWVVVSFLVLWIRGHGVWKRILEFEPTAKADSATDDARVA